MSSYTDIELPTNRKFGFFFSIIFFLVFIYFLNFEEDYYAIFFGLISLITLLITIFFSNLLSPFNKLWMKIGFIIGTLISPIIMGIIYFFFFTPTAFAFKIIKRDYLRLKFNNKASYWKIRDDKQIDSKSFKNQF
tara:strand:- start:3 stop:407 length:405 start_codon:yes stop_codon:yes gene_type:complete